MTSRSPQLLASSLVTVDRILAKPCRLHKIKKFGLAPLSHLRCSSPSMADKYEVDECGVSGGEEGVSDRECVDLSEPRVGAENQTMVRIPGKLGPLGWLENWCPLTDSSR